MESHVAFRCAALTTQHPAKIECLDVWNNLLVVGTQEGHLLIWEVQKGDAQGTTYSLSVKVSQRNFAKKAVTQITVVEDLNIIISLADEFVRVHSLPDLKLISQLAKTKGAMLYAADRSDTLKLCVAMKKKLQILEWNGADFMDVKELSIPDSVRTLVWCGKSLCVGFKSEYNLIDINTGVMTELFPTGKTGMPTGCPLPDKQILLGRDNISIFLGYDGKPTRKYGLSWSESPVAIGYSFPYVIALLPKLMEIRMIFGSQALTQSIPLVGAKFIATPHSLGKNQKRTGGAVYIASKTNIWRLSPIALGNQVEQLVKEGEYEEALSLCENLDQDDLPDKEDKLQKIRLLHAYKLFGNGQAVRAMEYFLTLNVDPIQVIGLYPNMLPSEITNRLSYPIALPQLVGSALQKALLALIQYLVQKRSTFKDQQNHKDDSSKENGTNSQPQEVDWNYTTDTAQIIDTCLVKAYVRTNDKLVSSLLRLPNFCHMAECENILLGEKKYSDLVLLYKGKNQHEFALKVLQKLATDTDKAQAPLAGPMPSVDYMKMLGKKDLQLILKYSVWILLKHPDAGLLIFTYERDPNNALPSDTVLAHLKSVAPDNVELTQKLVVEWLEFIILEKKDKTPEFANELIYQYFDIVLKLKQNQPDKTKVMVAGSEPGLLGKMRIKLTEFLEESTYYNPEKMLSRYQFGDEGLYEEKAILLSKIGEHALALKEYCYKLNDLVQAEKYCIKHYKKDSEKSKDVYLQLLQVLLDKDSPDPEGLLSFAFQILNRHYAEIDTPKALELLPMDTQIQKLFPFFKNVSRAKNKTKRDNQVLMNIRKSEMMKVKNDLYKIRAKAIKITDDTTCPVCNKKIGSAYFAYYPNGDVVHYRCYTKQMKAQNPDIKDKN